MSLEISFSCVSLRLGVSNFWPRGLQVSLCLSESRLGAVRWQDSMSRGQKS